MSNSNTNPDNSRSANPAVDAGSPTTGTAGTGGAYQAMAIILALIVVAALAYGLIDTGIKASALFNNL